MNLLLLIEHIGLLTCRNLFLNKVIICQSKCQKIYKTFSIDWSFAKTDVWKHFNLFLTKKCKLSYKYRNRLVFTVTKVEMSTNTVTNAKELLKAGNI